ncbi:MAG TPA: hypothetical protein VI524_05180 [Anaerolineales bacterium]|nr:hypothetical protein [Anaerolineales bacterium]
MPAAEKLDLKRARDVTPSEAPARGMPPLAAAGVDLAKWVLIFASVFIVLALGLLAWNEANLSRIQTNYVEALGPAQSVEAVNTVREFTLQIEEQRKAFREFWLQLTQMILLNLMLPVLTAILGYIFGSKGGGQ